MQRVLDYDPMTGIKETFIAREDGGFSIVTEQNCTDILELNKAKRNEGRSYYAADPEWWKVAEIPIIVQMKWMVEHGVDIMNPDHADGMTRLLNDPEWRYLKTAEVYI